MALPHIIRISRFALITHDLDAAERLFVDAFDFKRVGRRDLDTAFADLMGLPGSHIRESVLRLGDQELAILACDPPGRPYPSGSTSSDLWFQHFAIIVSDMDAAYARLRQIGCFVPISEDGPQRLPPSSGSVSAFKFRDEEGHPLELLAFPEGAGPDVWEAKRSSGLFLGIDHSAIAVADTVRTVAFFKNAFGLAMGEQTENQGFEQARMDALPEARVTVTGLNPGQAPPHVELLGYKVGMRRSIEEATRSDDIAATHFVLETSDLDAIVEALIKQGARFVSPGVVALAGGVQAIMVLDPDGHRFVVRQVDR